MILIIPNKDKSCINKTLEYYATLNDLYSFFEKVLIVDCSTDWYSLQQFVETRDDFEILHFEAPQFNKSLSINLGLNYISNQMLGSKELIVCDADVLILFDTLIKFKENKDIDFILDSVIETSNYEERQAFGIIKSKIDDFLSVDGYDSNFIGWGYEDFDIVFRIEYLKKTRFKRSGIGLHFSHSDLERTQYCYSSNLKVMGKRNKNYFAQKKAKKSLYGTMKKDIFYKGNITALSSCI